MEDAYFVTFDAAEQAAHRALSQRAGERGGAAAEARIRIDRTAAEVVVAARDRRGLFADLALSIARFGGNVVGARIFTSQAAEALDIFYVHELRRFSHSATTIHACSGRLVEAVEGAARGERDTIPANLARAWILAAASAFSIASSVAHRQ